MGIFFKICIVETVLPTSSHTVCLYVMRDTATFQFLFLCGHQEL